MAIKRLKEFQLLERTLLRLMYADVKGKYRDGQWREYRAKFKVKDRYYNFECVFRLDDMFLSLREQTIKDGQEKIILPASYQ